MITIAIDGPAASGKGTLARRIATHFDFAYLDTGKLYRAVGMAVLRNGGDPADEEAAEDAARALDPVALEDEALARDDAARAASQVAAHPAVRSALMDLQRGVAASPPEGKAGAVLDGRDIGTVICPDATVKLFVTADVEVRADRRHKELLDRGNASIYARVLEDLRERDARDRDRETAPMRPADDAHVLDTSDMTADAAFDAALDLIEAAVREALEKSGDEAE
ncbi:(d)CMP kinase [Marivibrio halodurans]|uniref:(d)CMP kinase n=1 Tax=Marivibrio halodurans TaxID=2039722 RepID=UPI001FEA06F7|nr:(d)CMP kinase [Marivibrio halodurans]